MLRQHQHQIIAWVVCSALLAAHAAASPSPDVAKHSKPAAAVRSANSVAGGQRKDADLLNASMQQQKPASSLHGTQHLLLFR
jgi:hypothetical protein